MKAVLISIQPKWCEKIANGEKTIEVRKSRPKLATPFKVYIYCTKEKRKDDFITISGAFGLIRCPECAIYNRAKEYDCNGKVIGEFVCDRITDISVVVRNCNEDYNHVYHNDECKGSCLTWKELQEYGNGKPLYGWHISNLKIYDKPKELSEFGNLCRKDCLRLGKGKSCEFLSTDGTPCNRIIPITRPPQSWCYVEELQNG